MLERFWGWLRQLNQKSDGGLVIGLVHGLVWGLVFGLVWGLVFGLVFGLVGGLGFGLGFGLVVGLVIGLSIATGSILSVGVLFLGSIVGWLPLLAGASGIAALVGVPVMVRRRRRVKEAQERKELRASVRELVGDGALAGGFLDALEELTRYVPERADALFTAFGESLQEYRMLMAHVASSANEVMVERSRRRMAVIQEAAQRIAGELTEEALATLRAEKERVADAELGDEPPALTVAADDFRHFLAGMREVREYTATSSAAQGSLEHALAQLEEGEEAPLSLPQKAQEG